LKVKIVYTELTRGKSHGSLLKAALWEDMRKIYSDKCNLLAQG